MGSSITQGFAQVEIVEWSSPYFDNAWTGWGGCADKYVLAGLYHGSGTLSSSLDAGLCVSVGINLSLFELYIYLFATKNVSL